MKRGLYIDYCAHKLHIFFSQNQFLQNKSWYITRQSRHPALRYLWLQVTYSSSFLCKVAFKSEVLAKKHLNLKYRTVSTLESQARIGSSTSSKEKKLTRPCSKWQNSKGMPPHCLSRTSTSAMDGRSPLQEKASIIDLKTIWSDMQIN